MVSNARGYDWATWLVGIMRSAVSGGATSILNTSGTSLILPDKVNLTTPTGFHMLLILLGVYFFMGAVTHMAIFLETHGMPDRIQFALAQAAAANAATGDAIADAQ